MHVLQKFTYNEIELLDEVTIEMNKYLDRVHLHLFLNGDKSNVNVKYI